MSIFKCKMCGGTIEFEQGATVGVCDSCGTKQTLPRLDDDRRANLYDRANHFRRNNEFDKAASIYEQILTEDTTDAEAYWSLVLCQYGIEYVEDPATRKRVPTVNRAQFTSIFDDDNYKSAIQYADGYQRELYEKEAKAINDIQKGILAISQKEEPFDVFICYKETDQNGRRTQDSVLANDLYHQLTQEGFKVFFARITLEDKLGSAYEPYIFAALNSAKVMVVLGTKLEHFNAVWVKNEWSRYLALVKKSGGKKVLIPAYRDMDPYDLPEEFSHLQAQDMSKLGFMQDLIRGIKKIAKVDDVSSTVKETVVLGGNANTDPLIKRAFISLEDGEWEKADELCEQVLNLDPENAKAYLGKLMAELRVHKQEDLGKLETQFTDNRHYGKIIRFADTDLKDALQNYSNAIDEAKKQKRFESQYQSALSLMSSAENDYSFMEAANKFKEISEYLNSAELARECRKLAKEAYFEAIYKSACKEEAFESSILPNKISAYKKALSQFENISEYKDSADKISKLKLEIEELERKYATQKKRNKRIAIILSSSAVAVTAILIILFTVVIPAVKYTTAQKDVENKKYSDAVATYEDLGDYKDSAQKIINARYLLALSQLEGKEYKNAYDNFNLIKDYEDSKVKLQASGYGYAQELIASKKYKEAKDILDKIGNYENSAALIDQCFVEGAKQYYENKEYSNAVYWYRRAKAFNQNEEFFLDACYNSGIEFISKKEYSNAITYLQWAGNHKDSAEKLKEAKYGYVNEYKDEGGFYERTVFAYLKELKAANYKDSASIYKDVYGWKVTVIAINSDPDDEKTDKSSISKYDPVYFHYKLTGGEPDSKIIVSISMVLPNGEKFTNKTSWEMYNGATSWHGWENGIYNNPAFGMGGKLSMKFYDPSGNLIGEASVNITS